MKWFNIEKIHDWFIRMVELNVLGYTKHARNNHIHNS